MMERSNCVQKAVAKHDDNDFPLASFSTFEITKWNLADYNGTPTNPAGAAQIKLSFKPSHVIEQEGCGQNM